MYIWTADIIHVDIIHVDVIHVDITHVDIIHIDFIHEDIIHCVVVDCRGDLDLDSEAYDKLPDLFSFSLDIKVSNEERPCRDQLSWDGWTTSNVNKLTPFSNRDEMDDTVQLYG